MWQTGAELEELYKEAYERRQRMEKEGYTEEDVRWEERTLRMFQRYCPYYYPERDRLVDAVGDVYRKRKACLNAKSLERGASMEDIIKCMEKRAWNDEPLSRKEIYVSMKSLAKMSVKDNTQKEKAQRIILDMYRMETEKSDVNVSYLHRSVVNYYKEIGEPGGWKDKLGKSAFYNKGEALTYGTVCGKSLKDAPRTLSAFHYAMSIGEKYQEKRNMPDELKGYYQDYAAGMLDELSAFSCFRSVLPKDVKSLSLSSEEDFEKLQNVGVEAKRVLESLKEKEHLSFEESMALAAFGDEGRLDDDVFDDFYQDVQMRLCDLMRDDRLSGDEVHRMISSSMRGFKVYCDKRCQDVDFEKYADDLVGYFNLGKVDWESKPYSEAFKNKEPLRFKNSMGEHYMLESGRIGHALDTAFVFDV